MAEQSSSQAPQQPASQPSPSSHSYPSPNMQSSYAYPPPQGHSAADHFRGSPTVSSMPLPPLNLPPIRAIEGQSQAPSQQHQHSTMGSPLAQGVPHMSAYYPQGAQAMAHHPAMAMNITSTPHNIRYAIQPGDQKLMSGGRHKKEIKRRTKTGCLTCRKRRIKCDEAHPTCRNCQKSKRDCLGYDPIFKQQQGPAQLQPANTNGSPSTPASASAASPASAYSNVPQGYAPASNTAYPPAAPPNAHNSSYDFGSAIDPALAGSDNGAMSAPHSNHDGTQPLRHDVKPPVDSASPYSSTNSEGQSLKAKRLNVDDLFSVCGVVPNPIPQRHESLSPSTMNEIRMLYTKDYAPGLDKLLETTWYTTKGWAKLENDRSLCEMFAHLIDLFRAFRGEDFSAQQRTRALEIQVVWRLLCLCRPAASPIANGTNGTVSSPEPSSEEVRKRLDVLEHLMTNHRMETNPLPRGTSTGENPPDSKFFETEFWYLVGQFASFREDEVNEVENTLFTCRNILGLLENRDVLYSIMIARHLGSREPDFPQGFNQAYNNNDRDPRTKLWVAKKFIEEEANGKGTTQVVQRLCDMAIKSWQLLG